MTVHELFEAHYADLNSMTSDQVKAHRNGKGSYDLPRIARAFWYFSAGFEAKRSRKRLAPTAEAK